ncbi:hypothetical protein QA640_24275 [Bradyrhizobium sp. CB82]|uniref:hypothetical protein n=1 Tax=Bradyrhizobium sp. CB82 TaxID=3039159 RepID=UPI0024B176F6|nr:hypothetical protein [Bradyrhizobium sp. CB82]WFU37589.1 hypothetical protein QA640_24275 [Bradyrhizobium sp. CB82]
MSQPPRGNPWVVQASCRQLTESSTGAAEIHNSTVGAQNAEFWLALRTHIQEEATMRRELITTVAAGCLIGMTSLSALAASAFEGVWQVKDTAGQPFEITLSSGGAAKATRGEGMTGTWKEEGDAAVITWNTGWTTKIAKQGNQYHKTAYRKGQALDAAPANSSDAQKVK